VESRWRFDLSRGFTVGDMIFIEEVADGDRQPGQLRRLVELLARLLSHVDGAPVSADEARTHILGLSERQFWELVQAFGDAVRQAGNPPSGTSNS